MALGTLFVFAVFVVWGSIRVIAPFFTPILLGGIVATFTFPLFRRLREKLGGRVGLSAVVMLLGVTVIIILPGFILVMLLIQQATNLIKILQNTDFETILLSLHLTDRLGWIQEYVPGFELSSIRVEQIVMTVVRQIPGFIASHGANLLASFANIVLGFFMMLIAAYFFYVHGERLTREMMFLSPLPDEYDREIFRKFRGVVDATFRGQVLTAIVQGAVTGVGLAIAGVPAPVLWGAVAALASLIPMVGAAAVWVPASIYLALVASFRGGSYGYAIFLLLWGVLVVSLVDNLIRPWAMRSGTNMDAIVLFFAILGGISAFGFVGILVGPLLFALLVTLIEIYKSFFARSLAIQNVAPDRTEPDEPR